MQDIVTNNTFELLGQADAKKATGALHEAQRQTAGPPVAALRLQLASLQQQVAEAAQETAAAAASIAEFDAEMSDLPAAIAAERRRTDTAAQDVMQEAYERVRTSSRPAACRCGCEAM